MLSKCKRFLKNKFRIVLFYIVPHSLLCKLYYLLVLKKRLNLNNPQTFNEKLNWLKLYVWPKSPLVVQCTDKYAVRKYVESVGLADTLNDLIGVWDKPEDIPWDALPEKFALKCTHGCMYNVICPDKSKLDIQTTEKQLKKWMKEKYGWYLLEKHYNAINPRIICEKYLEDDIIDYKFFCFDGEPDFMYVSDGLVTHINGGITFFDMDGNRLPFARTDFSERDNVVLPECYEEMKEIARKLSKGFPFVRVDLFCVNKKIYFSELTFTPSAGLNRFSPASADSEIGKRWNLDTENKISIS